MRKLQRHYQSIFRMLKMKGSRFVNGCCKINRRSERRMFATTVLFLIVVVVHFIFSSPTDVIQTNVIMSDCESEASPITKVHKTADINNSTTGLHRTIPIDQGHLNLSEQTLTLQSQPRPESQPLQGDLYSALKERTMARKLVIVPAVIDKGYLDLAVNFYLNSIHRLNLVKHTLFMCVHRESCEEAKQMGLPTFFYDINVTEAVGDFNTKAFIQKAMVKHRITYDIISMNFSVLLCDLDMYWFRSPIENVQELCGEDCDLAVQREANIGINSGFMFVKPTAGSKLFYKDLVNESLTTTKDDQTLFNTMVSTHSKKGSLKHLMLPLESYPDGSTYWTKGNRTHPPGTPCPQCLVVHNNWIVSTEAKIFRFKEHLMWFNDKNAYYSDPNRKYITYSNPVAYRFWPKRTPNPPSEEYLALKSAIGIAIATNRTLILPSQFHVWQDVQPLNGIILMRYFDYYLKDTYRESTFLQNKRVPKSVKKGHCRGFRIASSGSPDNSNKTVARELKPADTKNGATSSEVSNWLSTYDSCTVVEFDSLYRAFKGFTDPITDENFNKRIELAFEHGFYDQGRVLRGPPLQSVPEL